MKFVQIAVFNYPHEMYILKSKLESEGIICNELDINTVSANPFLSNAIGGVKLMVREEDAERAIDIMNSFYNDSPKELNGILKTEIEDDNLNQKSKNLNQIRLLILIAAIIIAFGIISAFAFS